MATATRKARKRAGIPFVHPTKTPTPPENRSYVTQPVPGPAGTHLQNNAQPRSEKKIKAFLDRFTPSEPTE